MKDFDLTVENKNLEVFMSRFDTQCMIKQPTRFRYAKPNYIDLILTKKGELSKTQIFQRMEYLIIIIPCYSIKNSVDEGKYKNEVI